MLLCPSLTFRRARALSLPLRKQAAKANLPLELQSALALTIFEAKGLEFDDVFLFNFFADSPADERTWRVITGMWAKEQSKEQHSKQHERERSKGHSKGEGGGEAAGGGGSKYQELTIEPPRPESFDRQRHSLLNEELKMLYTAVTRARVKVVFYDVSEEKRRPVFHYLLSMRLAKAFDSSETTRGLAASSTPEEWVRQARNLQRQQLYQVAALHLPCISPASPLHLTCISPVSPLHLPCISPASRRYLGRWPRTSSGSRRRF